MLAAEGCDVRVPDGQGCCGALSMHAGREHEAKSLARALVDEFERRPVDFIAVNAAGCGSHLKSYGDAAGGRTGVGGTRARLREQGARRERAARGDAAARDAPPGARRASPTTTPATWRTRRGSAPSRARSCAASPASTLVEIPDGDQCCGSAGTYNLTEPEAADAIGERKVDNVLSTGAQVLAAANAGCTLQIQKLLRARGATLPAAHPIEILDAAIRGVPLQCLGGGIGIIPGKT